MRSLQFRVLCSGLEVPDDDLAFVNIVIRSTTEVPQPVCPPCQTQENLARKSLCTLKNRQRRRQTLKRS
jgi:hypothetical protein